MALPPDFSDHPISLAEARSEREGDASIWTPRDALINLLRDIDSGVTNPDALVCVYRFVDDNGDLCSRFVQAGPDVHVSLGLLERGKFSIISGGEE